MTAAGHLISREAYLSDEKRNSSCEDNRCVESCISGGDAAFTCSDIAAAIIGFFSFLFLNKSGGEVGERVERLSWIEVREAFVFVLSYTFFEVVEDAVEQGGDEAEEYDGEHNPIHFEEKWRETGGK